MRMYLETDRSCADSSINWLQVPYLKSTAAVDNSNSWKTSTSKKRITIFFNYQECNFFGSFQAALKKYGVPDLDVFQTVDLYEKKDIAQVTNTIFALGREVSNLKL